MRGWDDFDALTRAFFDPIMRGVPSFPQTWISRLPSFWRLNLIGWGAFLVVGIAIRIGVHDNLSIALGLTLFQEPLGLIVTAVLREIYRRKSVRARFNVAMAARVVGYSLIMSILQAALAHLFLHKVGWTNPSWTFLEEWLLRIIFYWLVYMGWSLLYFWLRTERLARTESRRADAAQVESDRMELFFLRAQLDPHFLFNALNGIAAEIPVHPDSAMAMVRQLAGYLRYSLDHRNTVLTPFSVEMDGLSNYLAIEQTRFGKNLQLSISIDPAALGRNIPSFLLQPLLENAVKYSRRDAAPPWKLQIDARVCDDAMMITVGNSGTLPAGWRTSTGVGIQTVRRRLDLHYPGRHTFTLEEKGGLVRAEIELKGEPCSV